MTRAQTESHFVSGWFSLSCNAVLLNDNLLSSLTDGGTSGSERSAGSLRAPDFTAFVFVARTRRATRDAGVSVSERNGIRV